MAQERLDKVIASTGRWSRREVKAMVRQGAVLVEGRPARSPEEKVDPETANIQVAGEHLTYRRYTWVMLNKPAGYLSATEDGRGPTVLDLLPPELRRLGLFPVGRLDKDTSGLLLLTDDGDFVHRVISPKSCVKKRYYAEVEGEADEEDAAAFSRGIVLKDGTQCLPAELEPLGGGRCVVTVMEGKYHQVRRMLASRGKPVLVLRRLSIGGLSLGEELGPGGFRELGENDLCTLFNA